MKHSGTDYVGIDDIYKDQYAPSKTGIWNMNMDTGNSELIMTLEKMARIAHPNGGPSSGCLYFFREGWNPSGTRFIAFVKDPEKTVGQVIVERGGPEALDLRFVRFKLGEAPARASAEGEALAS